LLILFASYSDDIFWNLFAIAFVVFGVIALLIYIELHSYRYFKPDEDEEIDDTIEEQKVAGKNKVIDLKAKLAYFAFAYIKFTKSCHCVAFSNSNVE